jgi:NADPH:quinone reductase-like Zn-dependent oxidoreductase
MKATQGSTKKATVMKATQGPTKEDGVMKAMVRDRFGSADVLRLDDIETPRISSDEALVRVHASSVSIGDWFWLTGSPLLMRPASGLLRPRERVLGRDVAGVVEAVGADVGDLRVGDEVYGEIPFGAHAEYAAVPARLLARKPANLTFEQAAAVPLAGGTALQGLRDAGRLKAGQHVLVSGASGAVGTFAVQIAKALGAEVSGVCSASNAELVRAIGADHVIDYDSEDFTRGDARYDLIFDLVGSHPIGACRRVLTPSGVYVASTSKLRVLLRAALVSVVARGRVVVHAAHESKADLDVLRELIEASRVTPVIDGCYDLSQVPEAFRQQGLGHARGRKVISIAA